MPTAVGGLWPEVVPQGGTVVALRAVQGLRPVNAPLSGKGNALRAGERLAAK